MLRRIATTRIPLQTILTQTRHLKVKTYGEILETQKIATETNQTNEQEDPFAGVPQQTEAEPKSSFKARTFKFFLFILALLYVGRLRTEKNGLIELVDKKSEKIEELENELKAERKQRLLLESLIAATKEKADETVQKA